MGGSGLICHLKTVDWVIIIGFITSSIAISILLSRRARKSTKEYFKSGEGLPWWLLGTSMVATTFAADTPLALAGMVVTSGIAQNWYWWCGVPIVMAGVFFFARLWKRANPLTDMEFINQRYSGKSASFLRGFKALWMSLVHGVIVLGWVNLAMATVIRLVWPVIPRIMFVDGLMLALFLSTPLSRDVNKDVLNSVKRGEIDPIELTYDYQILKDPVLWTEIEAGVFKGREQKALEELGLSDRLTTCSLSAFPPNVLPTYLYRGGDKEENITEKRKKGGVQAAWPVTLADGAIVDYYSINASRADNPVTLAAGQSVLERDSISSKTRLAPLGKMNAVEFLTEIYKITSSVNKYKILFILFLITCAYVAIGGLWGVVATDFIQFWIAMAGCILMAVLAVRMVGGMDALLTRMAGIYGVERARAMTSLIPTSTSGKSGMMTIYEFIVYALVIWWSTGMTDGSGSFAQRMLSAKNERHAAMGYLWYGVAHFALRMWPWIIVGFAASVLFPFVAYKGGGLPPGSVAEQGYVKTMILVLPAGLLGILVAAFLAAYMSTISTVVNLGASYLMNDFYRPFIAPGREARKRRKTGNSEFRFTEKHYVRMGIVFTFFIAVLGIVVSLSMNSIKYAWFLLSAMYGGIGLIFILRWYWHRINAWTEVTCMASLLGITATLWFLSIKMENSSLLPSRMYPFNILFMCPLSVGFALLVTLFTKPVDREHLKTFYRKVQPGGPGWREIEEEIRKEDPGFRAKSPLTLNNFKNWILATITIYCFLFGVGKIIMGNTLYPDALFSNRLLGILIILVGLGCGYFVVRSFGKGRWKE